MNIAAAFKALKKCGIIKHALLNYRLTQDAYRINCLTDLAVMPGETTFSSSQIMP